MRKILTYLIVLTVIGTAKPVSAAMVDFPQIVAKLSDAFQRAYDKRMKLAQQAQQIDLMYRQGFGYKDLIDVNGFLQGLQQSLVDQFVNRQIEKIVEGTKEKNKKVVEKQKEAYGEAAKAQYAAKLKYTEENINKTQSKHSEYQSIASRKCQQKEQAKADYEAAKDEEEISIKLEIYTNLVAECDDYTARANETSELLKQLRKEYNEMKETANIIGTDEDAEYHELDMRQKALENQEDKDDFYSVEGGSAEWDDEGFAEEFQLSDELYKKFLERYFYNPNKVSETAGDEASGKRLAFQSTMDRVSRERRYLLVNSAAHLLQVSATVRREIPVRLMAIEKVYKTDLSTEGELAAMLSYAATRVENARSLLLYAKLLSAKIQYMAAKDLLDIEPKKVWEDNEKFTEFDLGRYILKKEYVEDLVKEYNKTINFENED